MVVDLVALVLAAVGVVLAGAVIRAVVEAVSAPGRLSELGPLYVVRKEFLCTGVHDVDFLPVGAAAGDGVGHVSAII